MNGAIESRCDLDDSTRELILHVCRDRRVLVTGAGGSVGSVISRLVASLGPSELVLLDIDETALFLTRTRLEWEYPRVRLVVRLMDIRLGDRLDSFFRSVGPEVVIHAAAYKHVPMMEESPADAVENNVLGTGNVVGAAARSGCGRFVMLSTDKAVNPTSVMGATKRVAEMVVRRQAIETPGARFVSVRFGNVWGSRGSVVPLFEWQISHGGPITVTHPDMVRYFIADERAAALVLAAAASDTGDVFAAEMGRPVTILSVAEGLIRDSGKTGIAIEFSGLRPGERLVEECMSDLPGFGPSGIEGLLAATMRIPDVATFDRRLDELIRLSRGFGPAEIRCMLAGLDTGIRDYGVSGVQRGD